MLSALLFAAGWPRPWPREALLLCVSSVLAWPLYMFGLAFLADWTAKALRSSGRYARLKVVLIGAGSCLLMSLWMAGLTWAAGATPPDCLSAILLALWFLAPTAWFPYVLAQPSLVRIQYHEEWASLPIEPSS
jgi:hypothetical protein